jgi:YebC/PmpR family DNA-binding regulatory protein
MAGHSAWKNIKHRKAAVDAKRGKIWSKCARAIIVAAKTGGGDPTTNLTLRYAIDDAKAANMPKATIENAIKKGAGGLQGDDYESIMYEGYGPGGVAILLEVLTNNRNRTAGDVRTLFDKAGGNMGAAGSVAYMFSQKGRLIVESAAASEERMMEVALDAGAEDVQADSDAWIVITPPAGFHKVKEALAAAKIPVVDAELAFVPANTVEVAGDTARKLLHLIDQLDDNDDVQKVHANYSISEEELAGLE